MQACLSVYGADIGVCNNFIRRAGEQQKGVATCRKISVRLGPHPLIVTLRGNGIYIYKGPYIFLVYHYQWVGAQPKISAPLAFQALLAST